MKKRPTLADVARAAGVSMMTVSRAVNQKPGLSDELRQKILKIAAELGFQPNPIARGLATRQTFTIGLVVPEITIPFFASIARGVEDVCYEYGYHVFLVNTANELARERHALNSLLQRDIDGAILCSIRMPQNELGALLPQIPAAVLVNCDLKAPLPHVVSVNVNDQRGACLAVQHLIDQGRRKVVYLGGPANSVSHQRRLEGLKQALREAGLGFDPAQVETCGEAWDVHGAARRLLERNPAADGVFAYSDLVAVGLVEVCQELGKRIPQDIALVSVDDIPLASIIRPRLTTLRVNLPHIGRLAMRTLLEIIEGEATAGTYQIEPELVLRESA